MERIRLLKDAQLIAEAEAQLERGRGDKLVRGARPALVADAAAKGLASSVAGTEESTSGRGLGAQAEDDVDLEKSNVLLLVGACAVCGDEVVCMQQAVKYVFRGTCCALQ